jgi:hypothetical protein
MQICIIECKGEPKCVDFLRVGSLAERTYPFSHTSKEYAHIKWKLGYPHRKRDKSPVPNVIMSVDDEYGIEKAWCALVRAGYAILCSFHLGSGMEFM